MEVLLLRSNVPTMAGVIYSEEALRLIAKNNPNTLRFEESTKELFCNNTTVESLLMYGKIK
jgi:hypothetical protein